jgi:hypothetical protein
VSETATGCDDEVEEAAAASLRMDSA